MNTSNSDDLHCLDARIEKLEAQNRLLKRGALIALLPLMAIILMGQARPIPAVVEAQKFVLRDAGGKVRAQIEMSGPKGYPEMRLFDESGKERTSIGAGVLNIVGDKGHATLLSDRLQLSSNGAVTADLLGGNLRLFGWDKASASGTILLDAESPTTSGASVILIGRDGKALWSAP